MVNHQNSKVFKQIYIYLYVKYILVSVFFNGNSILLVFSSLLYFMLQISHQIEVYFNTIRASETDTRLKYLTCRQVSIKKNTVVIIVE